MIPNDICAALSGHAHVCAYTRIALNLMRSLKGSAEKKYKCEERIEINDMHRSSDNHMVISEHCKSCYRKMSAQSSQKMDFGKITLHSRVCRNMFC